ncbi:MAG: ATP-binding cassette domain-containing protein [Marinilabiliales bacterium]|nr:ATP-binding cassette domain-containing protein [Marinilabiliales bacterium]
MSWTGERGSHGKGIIPHGSNRNPKGLNLRRKGNIKRRKTLERELEWVRMAPKARHAKSKARLGAYESLMNQDAKQKEDSIELVIPNGPRLGDKVIVAKNVSKAFGDKILFENFSFDLPPNGIVGVIGPNGAGKTTLFRMIMGMETCDSGSFDVGGYRCSRICRSGTCCNRS